MAKEPGDVAGRLSALVEEVEAEADARKEVLMLLGVIGEPAPRPRARREDGSSGRRLARKPRARGGRASRPRRHELQSAEPAPYTPVDADVNDMLAWSGRKGG